MKAALIPCYFSQVAKQNPNLDWTSLDALSNILSDEDLAFYVYVNRDPESYLYSVDPEGVSIAQSFDWINFQSQIPHLTEGRSNRVQSLFTALLNKGKPSCDEDDVKIASELRTSKAILIHCYEREHFDEGDESYEELDTFKRLMQQLSTFMPVHEMAKLPVFNTYLKQLAKDVHPVQNPSED